LVLRIAIGFWMKFILPVYLAVLEIQPSRDRQETDSNLIFCRKLIGMAGSAEVF